MAKGIISQLNAGGSGGSILITESNGAAPAPTGGAPTAGDTGMGAGTGTVSPGTGAPALNSGSSISFTETLSGINEGDLVSFDISSDAATGSTLAVNISKLASGTVVTGSAAGEVIVAPGEAALITGATVNGKIKAGAGSTLVMQGANTAMDKIEGRGCSLVLIIGGTTAKKKGDIKDIDIVLINDNKDTFEDKLKIKRCQQVLVDENHIMGELEIEECQDVMVTGNTVDKEIEVEDSANAIVTGNTVGGDLELENVTTWTVENNTVGGETKINEEEDHD